MVAPQYDRSQTYIARRSFKAGGRDLLPGDRVVPARLDFTDRRFAQMISGRFVEPLTRESYTTAMTAREKGTMGAGFSHAELVAAGILDDGPAKAKAPKAAEDLIPSDADAFGKFWIKGHKAGKTTRFDVYEGAGPGQPGKRLNPRGNLNGLKQVQALVDKVEAERAQALSAGQEEEAIRAMSDADLRKLLEIRSVEAPADATHDDLLALALPGGDDQDASEQASKTKESGDGGDVRSQSGDPA